MAWKRVEPFGHLFLSLFSLMLSTAGAPYWPPLLTIAQENPHKPSLYFPIYAYLCFLNPINYYLNIFMLYLDFVTHAGNPEGSCHETFLMKHLPQAAHTASFATLVLSTPLFAHVAISEYSFGFAIGACSVCLSVITMFSCVFKKFLNSGGFVPVNFFALCISAGCLFSFNPYVSFSDKVHLPLLFVTFVTLIISITLVILNVCTPSVRRAENFVIVAQSTAIAALVVGWSLLVYVEVANVAVLLSKQGNSEGQVHNRN